MNNLVQRGTASAAAVAFNTTTLGTNSAIYLALFRSDDWSGNLYSFPLDADTGAINATPAWDAASVLDARDLSTDDRVILTHDGTDGAAFQWNSLTASQQNDLRTNPADGTLQDNATGRARLAFIRGDRACEISASGSCSYSDSADNSTFTTRAFRDRGSRLGDIVHAGRHQ